MRDLARKGSWSGMIGAGLLLLGVVLPAFCYLQLGPFLDPEEIERRNAEHHQCDKPGCVVCNHNRQWLLENPGRHVGDMLQLAELPDGFVVEPIEFAPPTPDEAPLLADAPPTPPTPVAELIGAPQEPVRTATAYVIRLELLSPPNGHPSTQVWAIFPDIVTEPAPIYDGT